MVFVIKDYSAPYVLLQFPFGTADTTSLTQNASVFLVHGIEIGSGFLVLEEVICGLTTPHLPYTENTKPVYKTQSYKNVNIM